MKYLQIKINSIIKVVLVVGVQIFDLILIIIMVWGAYNGFRKGLVGTVASLISQILGFFIALKYYWLLVAWADAVFNVRGALNNFLRTRLTLPDAILSIKLEPPLLDLKSLLEKFPLPEFLTSQLSQVEQVMGSASADTIVLGEVIYDFITNAILNTAAFLIIWAVIVAILMLLAYIFQRIARLSVIGVIDSLGGLVVGAVVIILILSIIAGLLQPIIQAAALAKSPALQGLANILNNSRIVPYYLEIFKFLTGKIVTFWL